MLDIVPDTGVPLEPLEPIPFRIGHDLIPPIRGRIRLDFAAQGAAVEAIRERGRSECDNLEVTNIVLVGAVQL